MKLTKMSVDSYGIFNSLCLSNVNGGLNVIRGERGSGKSTLARYIRSVLYGFEPEQPLGMGSIEGVFEGVPCRMSRTADSRQRLLIDEIPGSRINGFQPARLTGTLERIGVDVFDTAFFVENEADAHSVSDLSRILQLRLDVPAGRIGLGNESEYNTASRNFQQLESRANLMSAEITKLENERSALIRQLEERQSSHQIRQFEIDNEIQALTREIEALNLVSIRSHVDSLDREISELRIRLETAMEGIEFVSRPQRAADGLNVLYRRLDEVDIQMRRWRSLHNDVQQQRIQLKDEMVAWNQMTIDSSGHPYHRAQQILSAIGTKVGLVEVSTGESGNIRDMESRIADPTAIRLSEICGQIRVDLSSLRDELGAQFKQCRHRPAAEELKRLRRCFEETARNLDALLHQRQNIIAEVRTVDAAGAEAIVRSEHEFCQCAQQEGFMQARRKFVGEISASANVAESRPTDVTRLRSRLQELETLRADRVRDLVAAENQFGNLEARRQSILAEIQKLPNRLDSKEFTARRQRIDFDLSALADQRQTLLSQIDRERRIDREPAHPILLLANQYVYRLTVGAIRTIWLDATGSRDPRYGVEIEDQRGLRPGWASLSPSLQQQVRLGLCFATVEHLRGHGQSLPMMLDEVFQVLDPELMQASRDFLADFCAMGNQVIVLTSDPATLEGCRRVGATVFDLPETSVSPHFPTWSPDILPLAPLREPEFLTPFTTRLHVTMPTLAATYPMIKYPPTGRLIDYSVENFESGPSIMTPHFTDERVLDESSSPSSLNSPERRRMRDWRPTPDAEVRPSLRSVADRSQFSALPASAKPFRAVAESPDTNLKFFLEMNDKLEAAPSIGPKTAERFNRFGVYTVADFLTQTAESMATKLKYKRISAEVIRQWQHQARLVCRVPNLRGCDAQLLVACGIIEPEDLAKCQPRKLFEIIEPFAESKEGLKLIRSGKQPNLEEVTHWIHWARATRPLKVA